MHNFRELHIWKDSIEIASTIFEKTKLFPAEGKFGIISQMHRSAVSIASNIAEGSARKSNKEFSRFLEISLGSCFKLETQLILAAKFGYISDLELSEVSSKLHTIQKMISTFKEKLS
jgi:four helix bundle protein